MRDPPYRPGLRGDLGVPLSLWVQQGSKIAEGASVRGAESSVDG